MNKKQIEESKKAYIESRNRIVFSQIRDGKGISDDKIGNVINLHLVIDKNSRSNLNTNDERIVFKDDNYGEFFLYNDSHDVMIRLFENYDVKKSGIITGEFEVFQNGIFIDILVPKK